MRNLRQLLLTLILLPLAGCVCPFTKPAAVDAGSVPVGFEGLPGGIGITLDQWKHDGDDLVKKYRRVLIRDGLIGEADELPTPAGRIDLPGEFEARAEGLEGVEFEGYRRIGMGSYFANSTSGRYAAFGVNPRDSGSGVYSLLVFDRQTRSLIIKLDSNGMWTAGSLAWSPDEKYVAYLRSSTKNCGGVLAVFGHPTQLRTITLVVVDLQGNEIAVIEVTRDAEWDGEVTWSPD